MSVEVCFACGNDERIRFSSAAAGLNYIADFMCKELMLVIETDGYTHQFEETIRKDNEKQQALEEAGFMVLRFTDDEVLHNIENVRQAILFAVETSERQLDLSSPVPPQRGGNIIGDRIHA